MVQHHASYLPEFSFLHKLNEEIDYNQGCHFTWKPGKTLKNLEFDNLDKNNLEFEKF